MAAIPDEAFQEMPSNRPELQQQQTSNETQATLKCGADKQPSPMQPTSSLRSLPMSAVSEQEGTTRVASPKKALQAVESVRS